MGTPPPEVAAAVGSLLKADPLRLVALASSLRAQNRVIESTVEGMSMGPGLSPGSRIRIALSDRRRYETGEVIAFLVGSQVTVHRVVHQAEDGPSAGHLLTRGDATVVPDPPLDHARILGPVTGVWREGRWAAPDGAGRRRLRSRIAARVALWAARGALYLGPRASAGLLALMQRAERALRIALA